MTDENVYEVQEVDTLSFQGDMYTLLESISKWTKFLSIVAFIVLGLSVISVLSLTVMMNRADTYLADAGNYFYGPGGLSWGSSLLFLLMILVYCIPVYFLFRFSTELKKALNVKNTIVLNNAFGFLQKHYMFIGILTIIALVLYVIAFFVLLGTGFAYM